MPLVFCSVVCWDSHLSSVRHRDAGAIEAKAPSKAQWEKELAEMPPEKPAPPPTADKPPPPRAPAPTPMAGTGVVAGVARRTDETRPNLVPPMPAADGQRRVVTTTPTPAPTTDGGVVLSDVEDKDVLIVVSKLKKYIKDRSGFNTSDQIVDLLSDHVRAICDEAIRAAARNDRKTVLERDVPRPPRR
jgi:hypothetical protein